MVGGFCLAGRLPQSSRSAGAQIQCRPGVGATGPGRGGSGEVLDPGKRSAVHGQLPGRLLRRRIPRSTGKPATLVDRAHRRGFSLGPKCGPGVWPAFVGTDRRDAGPAWEILNTFAYTCGFSICAAKAGARATSLDLSRKYLEWGKRNFELNGLD